MSLKNLKTGLIAKIVRKKMKKVKLAQAQGGSELASCIVNCQSCTSCDLACIA